MEFVSKMDRFGREVTVNKQTDQEGYLLLAHDFDTLNGRQNLYISVSMLRQLAGRNPQLGLSPTDELESARDANAQLAHALAQEKARADEAEGKLDRVNGMAKAGYKVVRQQGRPPQKTNGKEKVSG